MDRLQTNPLFTAGKQSGSRDSPLGGGLGAEHQRGSQTRQTRGFWGSVRGWADRCRVAARYHARRRAPLSGAALSETKT
jgi:hypothetical protein